MTILDRILPRRAEKREEAPVTLSDPGWLARALNFGGISDTGIIVSTETALQVPAVWAAVNFLSGTIAGLPLKVYTKTKDGRKERGGTLPGILGRAINDETSAFDWLKWKLDLVMTEGRAYTYIERNDAGNVVNLWPMDYGSTKVVREGGKRLYKTKNAQGNEVTYRAADVLDLAFMLKPDMLAHQSPLTKGKEAIGLALASMKYGAKIFHNGGVPPLVFQGPFQTVEAMERASDDLVKAISKAYKEGRQALALPVGHEVKVLGFDPEKMQLVELQRWCVEQIARIYSLPPTFLQDLTHGTHSNTEQQDLHFVKHTLHRWIKQIEQEFNLKLIGRNRSSVFVKFNVDGLLRGDFKTRMEGYAKSVQNAIRTPDEVRALEDLPPIEGGAQAYIQGATMPLKTQANAKINDSGAQPDGGGDGDDDK